MTSTTTTRTNENGYEFSLFKTPLRTPMRHGMLSSATLNDLSSYSNKKHFKFINTTSMNDLQLCSETNTTPIRCDKTKLSTPASIQRRRALGLVNHNSNHINRVLPTINNLKQQEEIFLTKSTNLSHPEDDLPHSASHIIQDTFDDLIPTNERIERMMTNQLNGINLFTYYGGIENTIRCQSPVCHNNISISTLLDILD